MEMTYVHGFDFEPKPLDLFELMHMETYPWQMDPTAVPDRIITEWVLPQNALEAVETADRARFTGS
jgi:hypothetical protein